MASSAGHRDNSIIGLFPAFATPSAKYYGRRRVSVEVQYGEDWVYRSGKVDNQGRWGKLCPTISAPRAFHAIRTKSYQASAITDPAICLRAAIPLKTERLLWIRKLAY